MPALVYACMYGISIDRDYLISNSRYLSSRDTVFYDIGLFSN